MQMENKSFGEILLFFRTRKDETLRGFAEKVGISPSYLVDIEKGRRNPPDGKKLEAMAQALELNTDDKVLFMDAAARETETVSADISEYILDNEDVKVFLRKARDKGFSDWKKWTEKLDEEL